MIRMCAWCRAELPAAADGREEDNSITHGICGPCLETVSRQLGMRLQDYLNTLEVPVLAVDSDVSVKMLNDKACALLQKDSAAVLERKGGDVFECAYAQLPGGCGKTVHCSACAIRIAVADTYMTGEPRVRVPAYLCQGKPDAEQEISMYLSTEKIGELVLLRIDRMGQGERS